MNMILIYAIIAAVLLVRHLIVLEEDLFALKTVRSRETRAQLRKEIPRTFINALLSLVWPILVVRSVVSVVKNRVVLKRNG
jgi:hypothetical protein